MRVIQIEPSFFGKPWIQPRTSAKSRSTQMYGQVVTSSPSSSALTTMKNSLYCERDGSTSSSPRLGAATASRRTRRRSGRVSGCGSRPGGRTARTASGRPSTRRRGSRRRSARVDSEQATRALVASADWSIRRGSRGGFPAQDIPRPVNVVVGRVLVADGEPQHVAAVQLCVRDEDLAGRVDAPMQRLVLLVARVDGGSRRPRTAVARRAPSRARRAPTSRTTRPAGSLSRMRARRPSAP